MKKTEAGKRGAGSNAQRPVFHSQVAVDQRESGERASAQVNRHTAVKARRDTGRGSGAATPKPATVDGAPFQGSPTHEAVVVKPAALGEKAR